MEKISPRLRNKTLDESNFEVNAIKYTRSLRQKYAFVSDYARFWILFNYGGLYFDTDVEVIKPLDDIISKGAYLGVESQNDRTIICCTGLGFGAEAGNKLLGRMITFTRLFTFSMKMALLV